MSLPTRDTSKGCPYTSAPCDCGAICGLDAIRAENEAKALATPPRKRGAA